MIRFAVIGPTYPYRGGIAHYTTLLVEEMRRQHDALLISFSRQYPAWLFPGKSDKDPSERPLRTEAEYLLNGLNPLSWWRTLRRLRQWQPEVVVMQWWVPYWAPAWAVLSRGIKRLPDRPKLIFICHNVLPHEQGCLRPLLPALLRLALSSADGFVVHSQADGDILQSLLPEVRYVVTPIPTYASLGEGMAGEVPVALPGDRPILLFAGFIRPYKGLDILLAALPAVLAKQPVHLLVAGEFWQGSEVYREQIEALGIGEAVTIVDEYLPNETLAACMRRADVVVLPYRSATQSAVVQMAFGQGTPVITTDVGGLAEVVENGRTGLVVPPEDVGALAAAINRFVRKEASRMQDWVQAPVVREQFSWEHAVAQIQEVVSARQL